MVVVVALGVMVAAVLAQHMGLTEAIAGVAWKIAKCPKCCTFWSCLIMIWLETEDVIVTLLLSLTMSYLALWAGLLLAWLNTAYNKIWDRLLKKR